MARRPRVEYPGAFYHVITRGNQQQKIFYDDQDRSKYVSLLRGLKETFNFHLHAYVLMLNHVHLLVQTGEVALSRIMQRLSSAYTQYFNRKHHLSGHLFQGRYRAILCDKESYLLELTRYLHLNPVRVRVVKDPADYRWSSYGIYLGKEKGQDWVSVTEVLKLFGRTEAEARKLYGKFVLEGIGQGHREELYDAVEGRILGDRPFVEEVRSQAGEKGDLRVKIKAGVYLKLVGRVLGKELEEVVGSGKDRGRVWARDLVSYAARRYTDLSVKSMAGVLGVDATCVSRGVARMEGRIGKDRKLKETLDSIGEALKNSKYHA